MALSGPSVPLWVWVTGVSIGLCVVLLILATGFAVYVFTNCVFFSSVYVYVNATSNRILLFSSVISRIPPLLPQVLMGVAALGFGYDWLVASLSEGDDELTPEQYSLILRICSTAGLFAAWDGFNYQRRAGKGRTPALPSILRRAVVYLILIRVSLLSIGLMDTVLHEGVVQAAFGLFSPLPPDPTLAFGRQINQTLCNAIDNKVTPCSSVLAESHQAALINANEGIATAENSSQINEVVVIDNVALLVDKQRAQTTFTARTTGWYTSCKPVTIQCGMRANGPLSPFACIEYPAFQGDLSVVDGGYSTVKISPFNNSGTSGPVDLKDMGAWSQPVEYGIACTTPSARRFMIRRYYFWK